MDGGKIVRCGGGEKVVVRVGRDGSGCSANGGRVWKLATGASIEGQFRMFNPTEADKVY